MEEGEVLALCVLVLHIVPAPAKPVTLTKACHHVLQSAQLQAVGRAGDGDILHLLDQVVGGGVAVVVGEGAAQGALGCGTATTSCASATSTPSWSGGGDYHPATPTFVAVASIIIAIVSSIAVILCGSVRCLLRGFRGVCR